MLGRPAGRAMARLILRKQGWTFEWISFPADAFARNTLPSGPQAYF
jgi:hypothetical protein